MAELINVSTVPNEYDLIVRAENIIAIEKFYDERGRKGLILHMSNGEQYNCMCDNLENLNAKCQKIIDVIENQ